MPDLEEHLEKLTTEIKDMDADLRAFMAAEKPEQGIFHAGDIHRLRQAKLYKHLELEHCRARMRLLQSEHAGMLQ